MRILSKRALVSRTLLALALTATACVAHAGLFGPTVEHLAPEEIKQRLVASTVFVRLKCKGRCCRRKQGPVLSAVLSWVRLWVRLQCRQRCNPGKSLQQMQQLQQASMQIGRQVGQLAGTATTRAMNNQAAGSSESVASAGPGVAMLPILTDMLRKRLPAATY